MKEIMWKLIRIARTLGFALGLLKEKKVEQPKKSKIYDWAFAIQSHEGYFPGSRSRRNENPFNFKYTTFIASLGATGADKDNFAIFPDYQTGFEAGCEFLRLACLDRLKNYHNARTLSDFFKVYAPTSDNNDPDAYANIVAKKLDVPVTARIETLL